MIEIMSLMEETKYTGTQGSFRVDGMGMMEILYTLMAVVVTHLEAFVQTCQPGMMK